MRLVIALFSGGLFGAGLFTAGATDTRVVHGWMDVFGDWNPVLGIMFLGSFVIMIAAWRIAARAQISMLGTPLPEASKAPVTVRMMVGATLFGIGWALSGMCPGPALASLSFNGLSGLVFCGAMVLGLKIGGTAWSRRMRFGRHGTSPRPAIPH